MSNEMTSPAGDKVRVWSFQDEVVVITHQTVSMHLPVGFLACRGKCLDEVLPVNVIEEYILPPIIAAHGVRDVLSLAG